MYKEPSTARYFSYLLAFGARILTLIRSFFLISMVLIVGLLTILNVQARGLLTTGFNEHNGTGDAFHLGRDYEIWNNDGAFELSAFDTGNLYDTCFIDTPWGGNSWGIEASSFDDGNGNPPLGYTKDEARFASFIGENGYLYGRNKSESWALVRFVQGDVFGGSNCGSIPWHVPEPLKVEDAEPVIYIDIHRDENQLLADGEGWYLLAVNVWFNSDDAPKPLVMDLIFHHECNWDGCIYKSFEDEDAYHYQSFVGQTPASQWASWRVPLNPHIDAALTEFDQSHILESLEIYQLEFVLELRNATGSASIDNFYLVNEVAPADTPTAILTATQTEISTPTPTGTQTATETSTSTATATQTQTSTSTPTVTQSQIATSTPTPTQTQTETSTSTPTVTQTQTETSTSTPTVTHTSTPTATHTSTPTQTATHTPTTIPLPESLYLPLLLTNDD